MLRSLLNKIYHKVYSLELGRSSFVDRFLPQVVMNLPNLLPIQAPFVPLT